MKFGLHIAVIWIQLHFRAGNHIIVCVIGVTRRYLHEFCLGLSHVLWTLNIFYSCYNKHSELDVLVRASDVGRDEVTGRREFQRVSGILCSWRELWRHSAGVWCVHTCTVCFQSGRLLDVLLVCFVTVIKKNWLMLWIIEPYCFANVFH
jgi:hypothetical protein